MDIREAESTTLEEALTRYQSEVGEGSKGAKQEAVYIQKWKCSAYAKKSLAALRSSDMVAYLDSICNKHLGLHQH